MKHLQEIRIRKELTQQKLSEISGISIRNIQYYEQGFMKIDGARISTLLALSNALGVRISDIVENGELHKSLVEKGY